MQDQNHGIKKPLCVACCVLGSCLGVLGPGGKLGKEGSSLLETILDSMLIPLPHPTRHFKWPLFSPALAFRLIV